MEANLREIGRNDWNCVFKMKTHTHNRQFTFNLNLFAFGLLRSLRCDEMRLHYKNHNVNRQTHTVLAFGASTIAVYTKSLLFFFGLHFRIYKRNKSTTCNLVILIFLFLFFGLSFNNYLFFVCNNCFRPLYLTL